jgi:hypothetical protein
MKIIFIHKPSCKMYCIVIDDGIGRAMCCFILVFRVNEFYYNI